MTEPRVILIGGAPGAGKTTLGCALAAKLGAASVTIDDLMIVARMATNFDRHPDLFLIKGRTHLDYFTNSTAEQLIDDAQRQHAASWPFVLKLITKHFDFTSTRLVIDGWHLRPHSVAAMNTPNVKAYWIHIDPAVLEARERKNTDFLEGSSDPERMHQNFMGRSLWINELLKREAMKHNMPVLEQDGTKSVDDLCAMMLR